MIYYYIIANGNGHHLFGHPAAERNQQESDPRQGNSSIKTDEHQNTRNV